VTGGLRTGDSKKIESIRINLRDLARSQVFPRDPGLLPPWNPGTRPGTTPGIPSKIISHVVRYPNDIDMSLNETAADKIRKYRADCNNNPPNTVSFK
jgi:hypothetical protein